MPKDELHEWKKEQISKLWWAIHRDEMCANGLESQAAELRRKASMNKAALEYLKKSMPDANPTR